MNMFRQGDVLIVEVKAIPRTAKPQKRKNRRVVVAEGEATGHAHAITQRDAVMLFDAGTAEQYLRLPKTAKLLHEEHHEIELPAGTYKIIHQREYTPEKIRRVVD